MQTITLIHICIHTYIIHTCIHTHTADTPKAYWSWGQEKHGFRCKKAIPYKRQSVGRRTDGISFPPLEKQRKEKVESGSKHTEPVMRETPQLNNSTQSQYTCRTA